jgi:hypothetical protein
MAAVKGSLAPYLAYATTPHARSNRCRRREAASREGSSEEGGCASPPHTARGVKMRGPTTERRGGRRTSLLARVPSRLAVVVPTAGSEEVALVGVGRRRWRGMISLRQFSD